VPDTYDPSAPFVETEMRYIDKSYGPTVLYEYKREATTHHYDPRRTRIYDARKARGLSFEKNGFTLVTHKTAVTNFRDADQVKRIYYPEIERLVREMTGATKVIVFGDALRSDDPAKPPMIAPAMGAQRDLTSFGDSKHQNEAAPMQLHEPAGNAHIDFNEKTLRRFAAGMLGPEAEKYATKRIALINLWRGVTTVERKPLAVCDASTVTEDDLVLGLIGIRPEDPEDFLEGFNVGYSPAHRWYYYPRMAPDELLVFRLCDSDRARPQLTAHSAFDDPSSRPDAPPRLSLEVRTISFFD